MQRMRRIRAHISDHDSSPASRSSASTFFLGDGRFTGPDTIEVSGSKLTFKKAVIATGARAVRPAVPGIEEAGYLTNETVFSLTEKPERSP